MVTNPAPSWGRLPGPTGSITSDLRQFRNGQNTLIRGLGRSYGDVCTNPGGTLISSYALNKLLAFDAESGILTCESGVTISDIQKLFVGRGWMSPVTPGTQFVTVGGAIANDVHGKNHHSMGTFGDHVISFTLARTNGELLRCSPHENESLFRATIGGLGLTGFVIQASIRLQPVPGPWLDTENVVFDDLSEFLSISDTSETDWAYSVSWFDCASKTPGRGILMRGNHAAHAERELPRERAITFPFTPPISLVNQLSVKAICRLYYSLNARKKGLMVSHYQPFFYPLDAIRHWNRMYGKQGFYQHQCVVPRADGEETLNLILETIQKSKQGSFLGVLKTFGNRQPAGMMSFARSGITLALDFPNLGSKTLDLMEEIDGIVISAGGAINPSKDARMSKETFESSFPNFREFQEYRDPGISSGFSQRLLGS
jgi:FAD/FMN-containing dehydrogenase